MSVETIITIALLTLIGAGVVAVQFVNALLRRKVMETEPYPFLAESMGFEQWQSRFLVDTRIQRFRGQCNGESTEIEVGSGSQGVYLRIDLEFKESVDLGLRVSSEHEDGFLTRFMRLREVELGYDAFDSHFILLARDENRLSELMNDSIRRGLVELGKSVRDLRLNDSGLHLQMFGDIPESAIREVLSSAALLTKEIFERATRMREERQASASDTFTPMTGTMIAIPSEQARS